MAISREAPWQGASLFATGMNFPGRDITADIGAAPPPAGQRMLLSHLDETVRAPGSDLEMI
ncbi:MAG: hypothetical protein OXH50_00955 [Gemmatimonadetes bacterium]|nr:hypothetical protein [Gemmatimonadota bacterium]